MNRYLILDLFGELIASSIQEGTEHQKESFVDICSARQCFWGHWIALKYKVLEPQRRDFVDELKKVYKTGPWIQSEGFKLCTRIYNSAMGVYISLNQ